jgi:hypothetical protein
MAAGCASQPRRLDVAQGVGFLRVGTKVGCCAQAEPNSSGGPPDPICQPVGTVLFSIARTLSLSGDGSRALARAVSA